MFVCCLYYVILYYYVLHILYNIPAQALLFRLYIVRRDSRCHIPSMSIHSFNTNTNIRTSTVILEEDNNDEDGGDGGGVLLRLSGG